MNKVFIIIFILVTTPGQAGVVSLKDNILFAFEKCKALSVDLHKGQLKEAVVSSFDLHCRKIPGKPLGLKCEFFKTGSQKKDSEAVFKGGSELGEGLLKDDKGRKIQFLIGKGFASFESPPEQKVCIGIFLFEKDALKKKSSQSKSR